ncbi:MAG: helix-turn-helix domain-containing protein [Rickettsiaceae bacterium]|jgi:DNA-binding XRE family transcriptional regulator|nr:helix-turn-helix domain-containing protein [Rickettsiaceae bacterium]
MITGFQFKAALALTNYTSQEVADLIGLHPSTLLRFKLVSNLEILNCHSKNMRLLQTLFNKEGLTFPTLSSIQFTPDMSLKNIPNGITRFHLVAARIATGLNQSELSQQLRISAATLSLLENLNNTDLIKSRKINNNTLEAFFNHLGIIFNNNFIVRLEKDPQILIKKVKMLVGTKTKNI